MLTAEQLKQRENKLTSSKVGILMGGDEAAILGLWQRMVNPEKYPEEDLSDVWAVRLGEVTEQLNLDWYSDKYRDIGWRGKVVIGDPDWMACTLDGFDLERKCPVECKHVGGREPLETIIARYQPQMHWQMMCTKAKECALSVIMGANEPVVEYIPFNEEYAKELMVRASAFMLCVSTLSAPVLLPRMGPAPPPIIPAKEYDFDGNNAWANYAAVWRETQSAAKDHETATKAIKELVPQDAKKAFGAGIVVTRNRAGSMSLREMKP